MLAFSKQVPSGWWNCNSFKLLAYVGYHQSWACVAAQIMPLSTNQRRGDLHRSPPWSRLLILGPFQGSTACSKGSLGGEEQAWWPGYGRLAVPVNWWHSWATHYDDKKSGAKGVGPTKTWSPDFQGISISDGPRVLSRLSLPHRPGRNCFKQQKKSYFFNSVRKKSLLHVVNTITGVIFHLWGHSDLKLIWNTDSLIV